MPIKTTKPFEPLIQTLTGHKSGIGGLVVLPNGDLASGSGDNTIKIWNANDWTLKKTLEGKSYFILSLTLLANGDLASGCWDRIIEIWDTNEGKVKQTLKGHRGYIYA